MTRRPGILLTALLPLCACGEVLQPTYGISIIAPSGVDPFQGATRVVLRAAGATRNIPIPAGMPFDIAIEGLRPPRGTHGPIELDAFDASDKLVAHGETPQLEFEPLVIGTTRLLVQAPGTLGTLVGRLRPRRDLAAAVAIENTTKLSALLFGTGTIENTASDGTKTQDPDGAINIWNAITHDIDPTAGAGLTSRRHATMAELGDQRVLLFGGEVAASPPATGFVPSAQAAIYQLVRPAFDLFGKTDRILLGTGDGLARAAAAMAVADGPYAFGGRGSAGAPLDTVVRIKPVESGAAAFALLEQKMAVARVGHTATAVSAVGLHDEILLFGGTPTDRPEAPVAEVFQPLATPPAFVALDNLAAGPQRRDHSAVQLADGTVLVLGGLGSDGTALGSGVLYDPKTRTATLRAGLLATARTGACAIIVDGDLLVAGGADAGGNPIPTAEVFDAATLARVAEMAAHPRSHAVCGLLPNHSAIILGGIADAEGAPSAAIEIYQPRR